MVQPAAAAQLRHVIDMVPAAMFLHIFLAFHTGRLRSRPERLLVVAGYAITFGLQQVKIILGFQSELQGSRVRVVEASRQELQRLERDLHDGAQVRLVALVLDLALLGEDPAAVPDLKVRLQDARDTVTASLAELRDVARGIYPAA